MLFRGEIEGRKKEERKKEIMSPSAVVNGCEGDDGGKDDTEEEGEHVGDLEAFVAGQLEREIVVKILVERGRNHGPQLHDDRPRKEDRTHIGETRGAGIEHHARAKGDASDQGDQTNDVKVFEGRST